MTGTDPAQSPTSSSDFFLTEDKAAPDEQVASVSVNNDTSPPERIETNGDLSRGEIISIVIALVFSFALVGLDQNIIATAVPAITDDFQTIEDIGWYNSVYRLTSSSFQPLFGKTYSLFPPRRVHLASLFFFGGGILLSALAPTSAVFIVGRALIGVSAAGVISGAFSIITHSFPLCKRPLYAGLGGGTEAIAGAVAPLLGGVLTDHLSWRWCFYIQLPFVLLTFVAVCACSKMPKPESRPLREKVSSLDFLGTTTFVSAITSLLLATQFGAGKYAWSNWRVILLFVLFAALLIVFFYIQHRRQEQAILPPRITISRNILFGVLFSSANNGALSIIEYYMPLYFQNARGMTATMSGINLLPIVVGLIVSVILSGYLTLIVGYYNPFMLATSILTPIANGLLTTLTQTTQIWKILVFQGLLGIGTGIGFQGPQVAVQTVLSKNDTSVGIGVIQFAQGIGPAIFIAVSQSIFLARFKKELGLAGLTERAGDLIAKGISPSSLSLNDTDRRVVSAAYAESLTQTFYLPVALSSLTVVGALGMEWRSIKLNRPGE
ncbi:MFS general substrate transporter [Nemania abortiva]|nr:MFS general substrate transporter [Nemania abortiva]